MWLLGATKRGVGPSELEGFLLAQSEFPAVKIKVYGDTQYRLDQGANAFALVIDVNENAIPRLILLR
jgi:hypothetical protein